MLSRTAGAGRRLGTSGDCILGRNGPRPWAWTAMTCPIPTNPAEEPARRVSMACGTGPGTGTVRGSSEETRDAAAVSLPPGVPARASG